MKLIRIIAALTLTLLTIPAFSQSSRNVNLSWTASTSSSVTGYSVYTCTVVSPATSCTPVLTGTPTTTTSTALTLPETIGQAYGFSVVANAPACTSTTPLTTPCGNSAAVTVGYVPVPPQVAGATNIVVVVQ